MQPILSAEIDYVVAKATQPTVSVRTDFHPAIPGHLTTTVIWEILNLLFFNVVREGAEGEIAILYTAGEGMSIDLRKYRTDALPPSFRKYLAHWSHAIEGRIFSLPDSHDRLPFDLRITARVGRTSPPR